ncbi:exostosin [Diplonema papillatum]|nr:exostosin [Diplonema papillatum]
MADPPAHLDGHLSSYGDDSRESLENRQRGSSMDGRRACGKAAAAHHVEGARSSGSTHTKTGPEVGMASGLWRAEAAPAAPPKKAAGSSSSALPLKRSLSSSAEASAEAKRAAGPAGGGGGRKDPLRDVRAASRRTGEKEPRAAAAAAARPAPVVCDPASFVDQPKPCGAVCGAAPSPPTLSHPKLVVSVLLVLASIVVLYTVSTGWEVVSQTLDETDAGHNAIRIDGAHARGGQATHREGAQSVEPGQGHGAVHGQPYVRQGEAERTRDGMHPVTDADTLVWRAMAGLRGRFPKFDTPEGLRNAMQQREKLAPQAGQKDRRDSFPFITGDGFRRAAGPGCICDEELCRIVAGANCSIVFVKTDKMQAFLTSVLRNLTRPFALVTHNSDYSSPWHPQNVRGKTGFSSSYPEHTKQLLDNPLVLRWFAQNPSIVHTKLTPVPIGIENRYNAYGKHVASYFDLLELSRDVNAQPRQAAILATFSVKSNSVARGAAVKQLQKLAELAAHPTVEKSGLGDITLDLLNSKKGGKKDKADALLSYGGLASRHKFCVAPPGHGLDTHRLWESLLFGCVPIVLSSPLDGALRGLPVVILASWDDLTLQLLADKYKAFANTTFDLSRMFLPYWVELIESTAHR